MGFDYFLLLKFTVQKYFKIPRRAHGLWKVKVNVMERGTQCFTKYCGVEFWNTDYNNFEHFIGQRTHSQL